MAKTKIQKKKLESQTAVLKQRIEALESEVQTEKRLTSYYKGQCEVLQRQEEERNKKHREGLMFENQMQEQKFRAQSDELEFLHNLVLLLTVDQSKLEQYEKMKADFEMKRRGY